MFPEARSFPCSTRWGLGMGAQWRTSIIVSGQSAGGVLENPHRFSGGLRQGGDLGVKYRYPSGPRV